MANKKRAHVTKMSINGQLVIPAKIRQAACLKPGMTFLVAYQAGCITLAPLAPLELKEATAQAENTDAAGSSDSDL